LEFNMFSAALIATSLLLSAQGGMQIMAGPQRQQFSTCLRSFVDAKIAERMAGDAFDTALGSACAEQETAYRTAYVAAAVRTGDTRTAAERDAGLEVDDLRENYKGLFHAASDPSRSAPAQ
jgi:hypothetical protein